MRDRTKPSLASRRLTKAPPVASVTFTSGVTMTGSSSPISMEPSQSKTRIKILFAESYSLSCRCRSDVLGHILPIVGQHWAQSGVAQLFTKIKNNGYRILYLSARAIGQAHVTREYLRSVRQDDLSLPDGPLLLNPTSLLSAFHR